MFLRTSFGISYSFYSGSKEKPFQGSIQGNGAVPPIWLIISIFLVRYLYSLKWIYINQTLLSKLAHRIAVFLHMDDTDLVAINKGEEIEAEVVARAQLLLD